MDLSVTRVNGVADSSLTEVHVLEVYTMIIGCFILNLFLFLCHNPSYMVAWISAKHIPDVIIYLKFS